MNLGQPNYLAQIYQSIQYPSRFLLQDNQFNSDNQTYNKLPTRLDRQNMLGWVLESQNDSPNRIYALHLPPLFRQQRENSRHGLSRELPPQRPIRVRVPSRNSAQNNNENDHEPIENRNRNQNGNNRGFSVNRRARRIQSRQLGQDREQNHRSQSIPTNFRVQHHRNLIPNPRNVHHFSPQNFLNMVLGIQNGEIAIRLNNPMGLGQPGRMQPSQTSLTKQELDMLPKTSYSGKQIQCSICLDNIVVGDEVVYLVCFHCFHEDCCMKWLQKSMVCPVCKTNVREHLHHSNQQG